jgi:hypothetical protein
MQDEGRIKTKQWELYDGENICAELGTNNDNEVIKERLKLLEDIYDYSAVYKRFKSLSDYGVYKEEILLSKNSLLLLLQNILKLNLKRAYFIARCLFRIKSIDLGAIVLAINYQEYSAILKR